MAKNSGRTGIPVSVALRPQSFVGPSYAVATRVTIPANTRFVNPGSAFGSKTTVGSPRNTAASIIGPAAYPPTPSAAANSWRRRIAKESHIAGASFATFFTNFIPPIPLRPAERIVSRRNPACGTKRASIPRSVPTNTTSLSAPRAIHSRAIASAGKTCPPVPPPAISSFKFRCPASGIFPWRQYLACPDAGRAGGFAALGTSKPTARCRRHEVLFFAPASFRLLTDIQEHTGGRQHNHQARTAITNEGQWNAFGGHHSQHHAQINQRLAQHHDRDAQRGEAPKFVGGLKRGTHSPPTVGREYFNDDRSTDKSHLFAQHGVNKIGVRFRQIKKFLLALHQANAGKSSRAHRDQRLQQLKAASLRVRQGIQERHHAFVAIGDTNDQQINNGQRSQSGADNIFDVQARDVKHGHGNNENLHGRAEVRFDYNEPDQSEHRSKRRKNCVLPVVYPVAIRPAAPLQEPCEIKNHGKLGQFGGLQAGRTQANPAMRGVRLVEKKYSHQHQKHDEQSSENNCRTAEL